MTRDQFNKTVLLQLGRGNVNANLWIIGIEEGGGQLLKDTSRMTEAEKQEHAKELRQYKTMPWREGGSETIGTSPFINNLRRRFEENNAASVVKDILLANLWPLPRHSMKEKHDLTLLNFKDHNEYTALVEEARWKSLRTAHQESKTRRATLCLGLQSWSEYEKALGLHQTEKPSIDNDRMRVYERQRVILLRHSSRSSRYFLSKGDVGKVVPLLKTWELLK